MSTHLQRLGLASMAGGFLLLAGCATPMMAVPTGGNRAGGTVDLSYEYGGFQTPVIDWSQARSTAKQRCEAWGYTDAEAFGGGRTHCTASNQYGCLRQTVTVTYQCTGNLAK